MQRPGFWDDQETAARDLGPARSDTAPPGDLPVARVRRRRPRRARRSWPRTIPSWPRSSSRSSARSRGAWRELEEARLFSGEYDAGDAVVTVRSGAGGTDSQDWAEMLLRMYLRWAERRGFQVEMKEASPGEEAGLKSATFIAHGRERLRPVRRRARRPSAGPDLALRRADAPPHRLRPGRRRAARRRRRRGGPRRGGPAGRHLPRLRRRRPARQQDRLGRPRHPRPDRDRRPVPERALADAEQGDGDADPARAPAGGGGAKAGRGARGRARRAEGGGVGLADPQLHAPSLDRGSRTTAPDTRSATPSGCWTATSTGSSASTCSGPRPTSRGGPPGHQGLAATRDSDAAPVRLRHACARGRWDLGELRRGRGVHGRGAGRRRAGWTVSRATCASCSPGLHTSGAASGSSRRSTSDLEPRHLIGCGAGGVVGGGREIEEGPAAVVWAAAMPEAEIATHHFETRADRRRLRAHGRNRAATPLATR